MGLHGQRSHVQRCRNMDGDMLQNGVELTRQNFTVSELGVPELRVDLGVNSFPIGRFTPIDFVSLFPVLSANSDVRHSQRRSALLSLNSVRYRPDMKSWIIPRRFFSLANPQR